MTTAAETPSSIERIRLYCSRHEGRVAAAFFAAGFVFDMITVGRIDSWATIAQQAIYLGLILAALMQMFFDQYRPPRERWYLKYRSPLVHFLLGALLNLYAIFYFKSSSLLVSFGFLGVLISLLLANELKRIKTLGLPVKFGLLSLCFLSFAACVVPIAFGSMGVAVFLTSMLAGSVPLAAIGFAAHPKEAARRQILVPLGCVLILFLAFYFFRLIPPVPLSIPFIGVYHNVERTAAGYRLSHERPAWRFWHNGDQSFVARPGDRVYVYFRVFSPGRFSDELQMRWHWKGPGRGWILQDAIPIRIVGGREQGFRGYAFKSKHQPGDWKVTIETADGREIGRVYFTLELAPEELGPEGERVFTTEID